MSLPEPLGGDYALLIAIERASRVLVGRLGFVHFPPGGYLYVGSARGPGGLRARLARHLRPAAEIRAHWHVDYLRSCSKIVGLWWQASEQSMECRWVQLLLQTTPAQVLVPGFGSSDCQYGCPAHLLFFGTMGEQSAWRRTIEEIYTRLSDFIPERRLYYRPGSIDQEPGSPEPGGR